MILWMRALRCHAVAALALALLGPCGCRRAADPAPAADDAPAMSLRIEEGEQLLQRIRARRGRGQEALADCRLAHALFARPLARLQDERAQRVARQLTRACRSAREHPALR